MPSKWSQKLRTVHENWTSKTGKTDWLYRSVENASNSGFGCAYMFIYFLCSWEFEDPKFKEFKDLVDKLNDVLGSGIMADFFPVFKYIPTPGLRLIKRASVDILEMLKNYMKDHRENFDPGIASKVWIKKPQEICQESSFAAPINYPEGVWLLFWGKRGSSILVSGDQTVGVFYLRATLNFPLSSKGKRVEKICKKTSHLFVFTHFFRWQQSNF